MEKVDAINTTPTTNDYNTLKYTLNKQKEILKKRAECDILFNNIVLVPRDSGDQLKINCSAGCYELFKAEILDHLFDPITMDRFQLKAEKKPCVDMAGMSPELNIQVFKRLNGTHRMIFGMYNSGTLIGYCKALLSITWILLFLISARCCLNTYIFILT